VRCRVTGRTEKPALPRVARAAQPERPTGRGEIRCLFAGRARGAKWIERDGLHAGHRFAGPAVITEYSATTLVPPGWTARVDAYGQIFLSPAARRRTGAR